MKKSNNQLIVEPPISLNRAVADLYHAFRYQRAPEVILDVCLVCCMDADLEKEMRTLPLRSLYRAHFYDYNTSAKSNVQPADELKYFVPRMCELLVERVDIHHSLELYLDRVGRCPADTFTPDERRALDTFAFEFFAAGLRQPLCDEGGLFQRSDAMSILLMFHNGGLDIGPLLTHWQTETDTQTVLHFARTAYWSYWYYGGTVNNGFSEERPGFKHKIDAWMLSAEVRQLFAERMLQLATTASAEVLATKYTCCRTIESLLDDAYQYVAP